MNTPNQLSDTPRTDAAWAKTFLDDDDQCRAGNAATDMRDACATLERELAALTAEVQRLRSDRDCEKRLRKDADEFMENAIERAMKAEAELVAEREKSERYRLVTLKQDADLATERARLDWLESSAATELQSERGWIDRAAIDAAMKEGA